MAKSIPTPHPYSTLSLEKFWRTAVAHLPQDSRVPNIWSPKFEINKETRILTAGSCFAQHISKWLIANGYTWIEAEKPTEESSKQEAEENGFGVFSFRTGNIYTAALLRQWVAMAFDNGPAVETSFLEAGRHFDPLRPQIPNNGFTDLPELLEHRKRALAAMREAFLSADLFVFTLGLTEGWRNRAGYIYPTCPGTVKGQFDPDNVIFFNQKHAEVLSDLEETFDHLKRNNSNLKFLLTVSPVPLTATASNDHVLVATAQSKSILRSVAGELCSSRSDVDYFPSFELISSHPMKGKYFADNQRTVTLAGVDHVMRHFQDGVTGSTCLDERLVSEKATRSTDTAKTEEDILCEDALLDSWNPSRILNGKEQICLIGDSHMGHLSSSLNRLGILHAGGHIMNGSAWTSNLLHLDSEEYLVPLEDATARQRWQQTLPFFEGSSSHKRIVTNIGQQTHRSVAFFYNWSVENGNTQIEKDIFLKYFLENNREKLSLLNRLAKEGYLVEVVTDPPLQFLVRGTNIELWNFYEKLSEKIYIEIGCSLFSARDHFGSENLPENYYSEVYRSGNTNDWFHGSADYYDELASVLLNRYSIEKETLD